MLKDIFSFKHYKSYLQHRCENERGLLSKLASASGCHKSYLSSCLNGKSHITLDHAFEMAQALDLSETEQEYFLLLITKDKTTNPKLRHRYELKLNEIGREHYRIKNQQRSSVIVETESADLSTYYESWLPTAVHALTSIRKFQTSHQVAKRLHLEHDLAMSILEYLNKQQLIKKEGPNHIWNSADIHLADRSRYINWHHTNWRHRAVDNIQKKDTDALHYTVIQSISESDFLELKRLIIQFLKEFSKIADPSNPEEIYNLNIDFFKI